MKPYILALTVNGLLILSLYLLGIGKTNDYGIFFQLAISFLSFFYAASGLILFFRYLIYKTVERKFSAFAVTFCFLALIILLSQLGSGMSSVYFIVLILNLVTCILQLLILFFSKRSSLPSRPE